MPIAEEVLANLRKMKSLYDCQHARVSPEGVFCEKGYPFPQKRRIPLKRVAGGEPLRSRICQDCHDFESMGEPIPEEDKGYGLLPEEREK